MILIVKPDHRKVKDEINGAISALVNSGLADDYNFAYEANIGTNRHLILYSNEASFQSSTRNRSYVENYRTFRIERSFNVLMLDGAMLQMTYEFGDRRLVRHRLAFLPSPHLSQYQNDPETYLQEFMYADVVQKDVAAVPIRFDYDSREGITVELQHPISHLTLGQYTECRIPVSAGVTPHAFVDFVLRSFYDATSFGTIADLPRPKLRFDVSIAPAERRTIHVNVPTHIGSG